MERISSKERDMKIAILKSIKENPTAADTIYAKTGYSVDQIQSIMRNIRPNFTEVEKIYNALPKSIEVQSSEKATNSKSKEEEMLEYIRSILLKSYPIVENRESCIFDENRRFDIELNYIDIAGREYTQITFLDGGVHNTDGIVKTYRKSLDESLNTEVRASTDFINMLISYIITDHDYITSIDKTDTSVELTFDINMRSETMSGISCRTIGLKLNFKKHSKSEDIANYYFKNILSAFFEKLKNTSFVKQELSSYVYGIKETFLKGVTEDDLDRFLELLNYGNKYRIIFDMDEMAFMEAYKKFQSQNSPEDIIKKIQ